MVLTRTHTPLCFEQNYIYIYIYKKKKKKIYIYIYIYQKFYLKLSILSAFCACLVLLVTTWIYIESFSHLNSTDPYTHASLQTNTDTLANSVDPDETNHN